MKVLIYMDKNVIAPVGGPKGYIYNLKGGLEANGIDNVYFLDNNIEITKENVESKIKRVIKKIFNKLPQFLKIKKQQISENKMFNSKSKLPQNVNDYDAIHFHSTWELYIERNALNGFKGKVILTSHSPKPWHLEYIDENYRYVKNKKKIISRLSQIDEYAFNRADYIIFPCEEAEEPYFNQWDKYTEIHSQNEKKYRYLLSGLMECHAKISRDEIRKKYNISNDAFVISYVGRHNEVKGYDLLLKYGENLLKKYPDLYIIVAGKEGPLYKINHERWIEVGWTKDPHSIIAASDVFVLPNRETYFDLVFLEVLSLGIPILASYTGGNKYFKKYEKTGIFLYKNESDFYSILEKIKCNKELINLRENNKDLYKNNFNEKIFAKNYIKLLESLVEKR